MENKNTSWGKVASWYDELIDSDSDSYQSKVIMPNLLRIIDPKPGMKILDLGCGQGYFSNAFQKLGATVNACDISPELIDIAQKKYGKGVNFFVSSADSIKKDLGEHDCVTIVLAIQNMEKISEVLGEASRMVKEGGRVVLVLNHPNFRIPGRSSWGFDEALKKQYRRVDGYMSEDRKEIDMTPGEKDPKKKKFTLSFHRPLQVYFKSMNKNNLAVLRLEEWLSHRISQSGPRSVEENRIRKEIPLFLAIEAVKYSNFKTN